MGGETEEHSAFSFTNAHARGAFHSAFLSPFTPYARSIPCSFRRMRVRKAERLRLVKPEKNLVHVRFDDILFSNTGTVGKTAIIRKSCNWIEGGIPGPQISILRVKSPQVDPSYLYHMISKSQFQDFG